MRSFSSIALSVVLLMTISLIVFSGCATTSFATMEIVREAEDTPERFLVGSVNSDDMVEPSADQGCRSPMVDPRDGTRLVMVRSGSDMGDYQVPAGQYGISRGELLRIECSTGHTIGVVRR